MIITFIGSIWDIGSINIYVLLNQWINHNKFMLFLWYIYFLIIYTICFDVSISKRILSYNVPINHVRTGTSATATQTLVDMVERQIVQSSVEEQHKSGVEDTPKTLCIISMVRLSVIGSLFLVTTVCLFLTHLVENSMKYMMWFWFFSSQDLLC